MNKITINKVKEYILKNNYVPVRGDTNRGARENNYVPGREDINWGGGRLSPWFVSSRTTRVLLITIIMFFGVSARSQNINIPNITGPMDLEVNSYTGNLFFQRTDFAIPGIELDMDVTFSYNSFDYDINKGFGNGWSYGYDIHYKTVSPDTLIIVWGDGREDICIAKGGGDYQSPPGFFYVLKEYETDKFSITEKDGLKYLFENNTSKKLTKITTPNGNYIAFSYNGDKITSSSNNQGQSLSFSFNSDGLLKSVTDAITSPTRVWNYAYDNVGNLIKVTDPLAGKDEYTYLINGPMQTVKDKNANVVDLIYYPNYALKETVGCNKQMSFSYDEKQLLTVATDHIEDGENQVNKYYYVKAENKIYLKAISSNCCGLDVEMEYDAQGNKIKQTDANGYVTRFTYDSKGNLLTTTDALGQVTSFTYTNDFNFVKTVKDPSGGITTIDYDANGNMTKTTRPDGSVYLYSYDGMGNNISRTDPAGKIFTYTYDSYGNLQSFTGPDGTTIAIDITQRGDLLSLTDTKSNNRSYQHDVLGRMTQVTDALNGKVAFSYDAMGNLTSIKNKSKETLNFNRDASNRINELSAPLGNKLKIEYDGMDNVIGIEDAEGGMMKLQYDKRNSLSKLIDGDGNEITYSYDRSGNLITQNLPSGNVLTYTYDALDRIKMIKDNEGVVGSVEYDKNGNITKYTDAMGSDYLYQFDAMNRVRKMTDPNGNDIEITYTTTGAIKTLRDQDGNTINLTYDDFARVTSMTNQNGVITTIGYDSQGNITSLKDANGNTTIYTYDNLDRLKRSTFPDGKYTENTYDANGNIVTFRNKDGNLIQFSYDAIGRVISRTLPGGKVYTYTYDKTGRVLTATNESGTVEFAYDKMGRLTSETSADTKVSYGYDVKGRTRAILYPDSTVVVYTYDNRNRLISIQKNNVPIVTYIYNPANQMTSKTYNNGIVTDYEYDLLGRLAKTKIGGLQTSEYTYDNKSNITSIIKSEINQSEFFTYDNAGRLLTYKRGKLGGPYTINDSYTYDLLGNRISASIGGKNISYAVNNLNQIISMNDGIATTNFQYSDNGDLIFDGKYTKTYDQDKRLIQESASPSEVITYQYDAIGRKISQTINGATKHYTYSGINAIEERDANNIILNKTTYQNYLNPVIIEKNNIPYYYHQNHQMSVNMLTDISGDLIEQYRYDVYGKQTIYNATGAELTGSITGNRYGFTGQVYDSATGHNQFYYRNYNPETGLFDQQDLIGYGDGMGMYQYVGNNPASGVDIMGLEKDPCEKKKTNTELLKLQYLDKVLNQLNLINAELKMLEGFDLNDKSKGLKALSVLASTTSLINKTTNLVNNWDNMSTKDANVEVAEIEMALLGLSNDVGLTGKIPAIGKQMEGFIGALGTLDAYVQEETGHSMAYHYAHLSDNSEKFGRTVVKKNKEREKWIEKFIDAAIKTQGTEVTEWTNEAKEYLEIYLRVKEFKKEHTITTPIDDCPQNPNPAGTQKRRYDFDESNQRFVEIIRSNDPNEMIAPEGQPDKHWVSVKDRLPYTVLFENSAEASAPAKYIKVVVPVDSKMDPATFHLSEIGFNNQTFSLPSAVSSNYQRLDARDSLGLFVDMTAGFDVAKNEFFWEFRSIDPVTMLPPDDPLKGFLLLQDTTVENSRSGHGFVNFSVKPVTDARTLDSVLAKADIVFDQNEIIPTNIEHNIIDAVAPSAQMSPLAATYDHEITLSWSGQDDPNGSGVQYYTLYISTDGINFSILKDKMTRTDTTFTGPGEQTYYFFVLATDSVGNVAEMDPSGVRSAYLGIGGAVPLNWLYFQGRTKGTDNQLEWATANERNTREFRVERSFDARNYVEIGVVKAAGNTTGNTSYSYTDHGIDKLGESDMYYRLAQVDMDGNTRYSTVVRLNYQGVTAGKTIVYPNPTRGQIVVVPGDRSLIGSMAEVYDEAGKLLQTVKITSLHQQFDLGKYTNGIYFIRLANKEVLRVMKH